MAKQDEEFSESSSRNGSGPLCGRYGDREMTRRPRRRREVRGQETQHREVKIAAANVDDETA
jgi:hypothetical protein